MANKNKKWNWIAEYLAYRALENVFRLFPVSLCYRFGSLLGLISHRYISKRRCNVLRNLRIAFGDEKSKEELEELTKEVFKRTGGNLVASIKTATMSKRSLMDCLTIERGDLVEQFVEANNGGVLLLPHMGNWEVCARLNELVYPDLPAGGMYRPLNNPHIDKVVKARREGSGSKLFARNDGMSAPLNLIREKGLLGILADQRVGGAGQITPFFGRLTPFSPLPQIFKKRTKCCVLGLSVITTAPGRWTIKYTLEADCTTSINTGDVAAIMEKLMRYSPADCFWLQDRWQLEHQVLTLAGKTPIASPLNNQSAIKKQNFAIYLDQIDDHTQAAVDRLAAHRPDIKLISFIAKDSGISSPPTQNFTTCPNIEESEDFLKFVIENDQTQYIDVLIVPDTYSAEQDKNLLTRIEKINYQDLTASLEAIGLPKEPIA